MVSRIVGVSTGVWALGDDSITCINLTENFLFVSQNGSIVFIFPGLSYTKGLSIQGICRKQNQAT